MVGYASMCVRAFSPGRREIEAMDLTARSRQAEARHIGTGLSTSDAQHIRRESASARADVPLSVKIT